MHTRQLLLFMALNNLIKEKIVKSSKGVFITQPKAQITKLLIIRFYCYII